LLPESTIGHPFKKSVNHIKGKSMIDKQKFNENYDGLGAETIIEVIIDPFHAELPIYIELVEKNIDEHNLIELKWNVHKMKAICGQMYDFESNNLGELLEDAVLIKILAITDLMMQSEPDALKSIKGEYDGVTLYMEIYRNVTNQSHL
jgi:hypothetical protein